MQGAVRCRFSADNSESSGPERTPRGGEGVRGRRHGLVAVDDLLRGARFGSTACRTRVLHDVGQVLALAVEARDIGERVAVDGDQIGAGARGDDADLAAALGQLDRQGEAKETSARAVATAPVAFEMYMRARPPWTRTEDHAHMLEGLRKAGLPEG